MNNKYIINDLYKNYNESYNEINKEYHKDFLENKWDIKLSLDSFNKMNGSDTNKGIYKFSINTMNPKTYGNTIGSYASLENVTEIKIESFLIPLPFLKNSVINIADNNTSINTNIEFLNYDTNYIEEDAIVNSDFKQNITSSNGSDYLEAYRSQLSNGHVYIGINEFKNYGGFIQKGNVYHFEFYAEFVNKPYPSLKLTPIDEEFMTFKNPINEITTLTMEFLSSDGQLKMPNDIIKCYSQIDTTDYSLYFLPHNIVIDDITSYFDNLKGSSALLENFTFNYKDDSGKIYNKSGEVIRKNNVLLKSPYGTYENDINNNGIYIDIDDDSNIIPIPTPSNLNISGEDTNINYTEVTSKHYTLYNNTTTAWTYTGFNSKSLYFNLKLLAHRLIIPIRLKGFVSKSS